MNILCKLGLHKPDEHNYIRVEKYRGDGKRHGSKYYSNYHVCKRCGKRLCKFSFKGVK